MREDGKKKGKEEEEKKWGRYFGPGTPTGHTPGRKAEAKLRRHGGSGSSWVM